jgi:hypothetical protein
MEEEAQSSFPKLAQVEFDCVLLDSRRLLVFE